MATGQAPVRSDYRDNQRAAQQAWAQRNPDYWHSCQLWVPNVGYWKKTSATPSSSGSTNAFGGSNMGPRASKTVNVNLNVGGKKVAVSATESAAEQLVRALEAAQRSAGA